MVSGQFDGVEGDATMVDCVKSACGYSGALDHGTVKYTSIDMYSKLKTITIVCPLYSPLNSSS
ncbi:hypothetical protein Pyn_28645 [Prunus yedoensis var. nudiflora]|uniref:Uncharacterized protein n=1 Tax=Prunus yedoensis var. nudiflora TaxID=2094558 RepID=A0A314ZFP8_PRUYE|nr:hypothetical protein Pyn_28645 [Prunus yedoensis var. nudiflora]